MTDAPALLYNKALFKSKGVGVPNSINTMIT